MAREGSRETSHLATKFGRSITVLPDLDGDGTADLAVGAIRDDQGGPDRGTLWLLFMNPDGSVADEQKLSPVGALDAGDELGTDVALLGDLDVDGSPELAVGARLDEDGGEDSGAVWIVSVPEPTADHGIVAGIAALLALARVRGRVR